MRAGDDGEIVVPGMRLGEVLDGTMSVDLVVSDGESRRIKRAIGKDCRGSETRSKRCL